MNLLTYLQQLNSAENQTGVWVDPENIDRFRIGDLQFENGGMLDNWVFVGTLEQLSFGSQSYRDAFKEAATAAMEGHRYNEEALFEAWSKGELAPQLQRSISAAIEEIHAEWSAYAANEFVEESLPEILAGALEIA